jgi:hypothetical protein
VISRRRSQRRRADARSLWLDAMRIAEQLGELEPRADPALASGGSQVCRAALADVFEAVWARKPVVGAIALRDAEEVLEVWAETRQPRSKNERRPQPPSAAAHVLTAPSLAELTAATARDGAIDLDEIDSAAELPNQHTLLQLAGWLVGGGSCALALEQLLELHDTDLRYALEAIALQRRLWPVGSDLRWLHAAQALHAASGGSDDGR